MLKKSFIFVLFMAMTGNSWALGRCRVKLRFHKSYLNRDTTFVKYKLSKETTRFLKERGIKGKTEDLDLIKSLVEFEGKFTTVERKHRLISKRISFCDDIKMKFAGEELPLRGKAVSATAPLGIFSVIGESILSVFTVGLYPLMAAYITGKPMPLTDKLIYNNTVNSRRVLGEFFGPIRCDQTNVRTYVKEGSFLKCPKI